MSDLIYYISILNLLVVSSFVSILDTSTLVRVLVSRYLFTRQTTFRIGVTNITYYRLGTPLASRSLNCVQLVSGMGLPMHVPLTYHPRTPHAPLTYHINQTLPLKLAQVKYASFIEFTNINEVISAENIFTIMLHNVISKNININIILTLILFNINEVISNPYEEETFMTRNNHLIILFFVFFRC